MENVQNQNTMKIKVIIESFFVMTIRRDTRLLIGSQKKNRKKIVKKKRRIFLKKSGEEISK